MTTEVQTTELDSDAKEYKEQELQVAQNFLKGMIKLGAILRKHRDKWKPKKQYMEYLSKIDIAVSSANQMIRIFEYSLNNMKNLLSVNLTSWDKVNMFLTLPDDLKGKLAEDIDGSEVTIDEFREKITVVRADEVEEVEIVPAYPIDDEAIEEMIKTAPLDNGDIDFMAKQMIAEMRNTAMGDFSPNCVPIAAGFLHLEQAIKYWDAEKFEALTNSERKFWSKIVKSQMDRLTKLLK